MEAQVVRKEPLEADVKILMEALPAADYDPTKTAKKDLKDMPQFAAMLTPGNGVYQSVYSACPLAKDFSRWASRLHACERLLSLGCVAEEHGRACRRFLSQGLRCGRLMGVD